MSETMEFPKTFEEFIEQYKFVDKEQIYTNGSELIPVSRVKQWIDHEAAIASKRVEPEIHYGEEGLTRLFEHFMNDVKIFIGSLYKVNIESPEIPMKTVYCSEKDIIIPNCDAYNGDVAFNIIFEIFPNFVLQFTTDSICTIFANSSYKIFDNTCTGEILMRINDTICEYLKTPGRFNFYM